MQPKRKQPILDGSRRDGMGCKRKIRREPLSGGSSLKSGRKKMKYENNPERVIDKALRSLRLQRIPISPRKMSPRGEVRLANGVPLADDDYSPSVLRRVTMGAGNEEHASCASSGSLAFTKSESTTDVWSLPFDLDRGSIRQARERTTAGPVDRGYPSLSGNGRYPARIAGGKSPCVKESWGRTTNHPHLSCSPAHRSQPDRCCFDKRLLMYGLFGFDPTWFIGTQTEHRVSPQLV
jgi:hypothetical protein